MLDRIVRLLSAVLGGGTRDEIKPLNVSIDVGTVDPAGDSQIPVELRFQSNPSYIPPPGDVIVGLEGAFESDDEGAVEIAHPALVASPESVRDLEPPHGGVADFDNPHEDVADFENPHQHGKLMHVSPSDLVLPLEPGEVTLGVGVFPEGPAGPSEHWGTDTVALAVEDPDEMRVRRRSGFRDGRRSLEVYHPSPFDPADVRLGPRPAFDHVSDEHGREVRVAEGAADDIARPIGSVAVAGHENHWLLEFPAADADRSRADGWDDDLVAAIVPDGDEAVIPAGDWALVRAGDAPDLDATG